jgi:glycosyltransferase involved in cell wall biosynthesis
VIVLSIFYKNKKGGFSKRLYQFFQCIASAGHELHFISAEPLPFEHPKIIQHIIQVPFTKQENLAFWLCFAIASIWVSYSIPNKYGITNIVTFGPFYTALCSGLIKTKNIPAITFIRADSQRHSISKGRNFVFFYLEMIGIKLSRKIVFVSSALRNTYQDRYGIPQEKMYVLPNNVDSLYRIEKAKKDELRRCLNIAPETFLLSTMGDINRIKNHEHIIRAMAYLNDANIKLMLIGDDVKESGEKERLEALIQSLSLAGKVLFCGWQDKPLQYVACSDLFVFPSKYEGSPNALLEALSCGIPCIGSDIEEIREILEYRDLVFSLDSAHDLAGLIGKAMSDNDYYTKLRLMSQERCNKFMFDWDQRAVSLVIDN